MYFWCFSTKVGTAIIDICPNESKANLFLLESNFGELSICPNESSSRSSLRKINGAASSKGFLDDNDS